MRRALQLNTSWEPMNFISDEAALRLILKGRAEIIHGMDGVVSVWPDLKFKSINHEFSVPATIRLVGERVNRKWRPPRFRKKVLFNRDKWTCAYCREHLTWRTATIDHIHPESKGGPTTWSNCVAACQSCNKKKANKSLEESGMRLLVQPCMPGPLDFWDVSRCNAWHPHWDDFIASNG